MTQRTVLTRELREIRAQLLELASLAERAVQRALDALVTRDFDLAQQVIDDDGSIDRLRFDIEQRCYELMATQQPAAGDLREVITTLSLATELERIADYAKGIARLTQRLIDAPVPSDLVGLPEMGREVRCILRGSLDAYVERDPDMAHAVVAQDQPIDRRYESIFHQLLGFMGDAAATRMSGTYLLWIAHNLERIADRATNIAERVVFLTTGIFVELDTHAEALD